MIVVVVEDDFDIGRYDSGVGIFVKKVLLFFFVYLSVGIVENELNGGKEVVFVRVIVIDNDICFGRERFNDSLFFVVMVSEGYGLVMKVLRL